MAIDIERSRSTAERLIAELNGHRNTAFGEMCDTAFTVQSSVLRAGLSASIDSFVAACRTRYPQVTFELASVEMISDGFVASCVARYSGDSTSAVIAFPCTCRVEYASSGRIAKLWFDHDEYEIVRQRGGVCSEPGSSLGSESVNQSYTNDLVEAVLNRRRFGDALEPLNVHASVELFRDLDTGVETQIWQFEGTGKIDALLSLIYARFQDRVEVSLGSGISQGYTTTFRGHLRGQAGNARQRYIISVSVSSSGGRMNECWVKIAPPPTLRDCLT